MDDIEKQYDVGNTAKKYNAQSVNNLANDFGRAFLKKQISAFPKDTAILDVGCGTGTDLQVYKNMGFSKLFGVDPSEKSLNEAKERIPETIELRIGTFENIPYEDGFFDVVVSRHALHYSKNIQTSIEEVCRVLKKGGKFIVIISNPAVDTLEELDKDNNVLVSLFNGEVKITFPLHKISDYFSKPFFDSFSLEGVYEFPGIERDGKAKNMDNTLGFIAKKK